MIVDDVSSTCPAIDVVLYDNVADTDISVSTTTQNIFTYDSAAETLTTITSDLTTAGTYYIKMKAKFQSFTNSYQDGPLMTFTLSLSPCAADSLSIDTSVFIPTVMTYNVFNTAESFDFTDAAAISAGSLTTCGNYVWTITMKSDGSAIDSAVFTLNFASSPMTITADSSDALKVGTYSMTATVKYQNFANVTPATRDFDIVVANPCATATLSFGTAVP